MNIETTVHIWREADQFIAQAMPLDVASSGPTEQAAREALDEAVRVFLLTLVDQGSLEQVLEECGYRLSAGVWQSPDSVAFERHAVAV